VGPVLKAASLGCTLSSCNARTRPTESSNWVLLAGVIVVIALFPEVLAGAAAMLGVQVPANLLFFLGSLVLLGVNVQLSSELGRLEERTRTLAEEVALLRLSSREHR
ncbi:DUF2304 domain-containing protein, partial [Nonomuraea sp. NPDC055795]